MSLILEALKKLERERETTSRGFLVVAHAPWPAARARAVRLGLILLAAGAVSAAAAWGAWTLLAARARATPSATVSAPAAPPSAAASAAPLPPPIWEAALAESARARTAVAPVEPAAQDDTPAVAATPEGPGLVIAAQEPPAAPAVALHLEAISAQDGEPVAVINGRLVRKGETIDGALVTWIGADAVEVEIAGRRRVIGF